MPPPAPPPLLRILIAAIAALLIAVPLTIGLVDDHGQHGVTVTLGGPGHKRVTLPPDAVDQVRDARDTPRTEAPPIESALHETSRPTATELHRAYDLAPAGQPAIPDRIPQAAPSIAGCRTLPVRNYSTRHGAPILLGVIHWTGSRPIPLSWADVLAIVRWFDTPAASASSNEITDDDGHCALVVPEPLKAWTQAAANPYAVSVEHINAGVQPLFSSPAGRRIVLRLMRGWHHRWHLPYRRGIVNKSTCVPVRSGYLAHRDLGPCGGGHPDVGTFNLDGLIAEAARTDPSAPKPIPPDDRARCRKITWWRSHGRPHGTPERRAVTRRRVLTRHGVTCTARGPVRR